MMIDAVEVNLNLDLKEGKAFYAMPIHMLGAEQLAKAYAYALNEFGESVQSRIVLDAIKENSDETLEDQLFDDDSGPPN